MALPAFDCPPEISLGAPFWDGVAAGELRIARCSECGSWQWYPDDVGACHPGATYEWVPVAGTGSVFTFTTVRRSFLPGESKTPYVVGLIELDGVDGVRFVGNLAEGVDWAIGDRVRVTFESIGHRRHPVFVPE